MIFTFFLMISQGCDPVLTGLFTPPRPEIGRYEVCTADRPLGDVVSEQSREGYRFGATEALEPLDALGNSGIYDRFAVVRLYSGGRARVVHGWRRDGDAFESVTLVSPYPDASLTHLMSGTMAIRWRTIIRSSQ